MVTISQNSLLNYCDSFVSTHLDSSCRSRFRFNVGGFFLESSIDAKIKSVPVFIFSLQRHEVRQTYISCFYAQDFPVLFENFNKKREFKDDFFFFNWFDHEDMIPKHPLHQDDISNVFYYSENRFFDYRIFDSTEREFSLTRRLTGFECFQPAAISFKPRFIRRTRFYKRKFDWLLKQHA